MLITRVGKAFYKIIPESPYDLINLSLILNRSSVQLHEKHRVKKTEFETKKDLKLVLKKIILTNISHTKFNSLDALEIVGQYQKNLASKNLYLNVPFYLKKKFSKNQKKFLKNLAEEKIYYVGVDVNCIVVGYSKNYTFTEIYRKQFNFKRIDLRKQVSIVLDKFKIPFKENPTIFKCLTQFVKDFTRSTSREWKLLERDIALDWQSCINSKIREQKLIRYFVSRKTSALNTKEELLVKIAECNIKELFINPQIDLNLYNYLVPLLAEKIKIIPFKPELHNFMKEGFLGYTYF